MHLLHITVFYLFLAFSSCQTTIGPISQNPKEFNGAIFHEEPMPVQRNAVEHPVFHSDTPPEDEIKNNGVAEGEMSDPVVGVPFPLLGAIGAGAKIRGATALAIAEANALALKNRAELEKALIDAKLHHDLIASKARLAGHHALFNAAILGVDRKAEPEDTPQAIKQDIDNDMAGVNPGTENNKFPQMINRLNEMFTHPITKRDIPHGNNQSPHLKRDEQLYLWSLNNFGDANNVGIPQLPVSSEPHNHADSSIDPIEDIEVLKPVEEIQGNLVPEEDEFAGRIASAPILGISSPRHFGHLHHRGFGFHHGFHAGGNNLEGFGGEFGKFRRPTEITINNQQNTFTNTVPTQAGNSNFQISQTTGQAGSSQAHSASNHGRGDLSEHGHDHHGHFRQANGEQVQPPNTPKSGAGSKMQSLQSTFGRQNLRVDNAQQMRIADHFLGMRSLIPQSGSMTSRMSTSQVQIQ